MTAIDTATRCALRCVQTAVLALCSATASDAGFALEASDAGFAQESTSAPVAKELVAAMTQRKLDAIAVQDPEAPDRFIAAMVFPGVQVLMVAARSSSSDYLRYQLGQKHYSDVHAALQSSAVPETKVFFHDLDANGLRPGDETVDIMYERGTTQTMFDGHWKNRGLSDSEYGRKFREADAQYRRLLALALDAVRALAKAEDGGAS